MDIACGNHASSPRPVRHSSVGAVRACFLDPAAEMGCPWLSVSGRDEDGGMVVEECGGLVWHSPRGWRCERGHGHVCAEARRDEGWDYAADAGEAELLRRRGVGAVAMDGGGIR